VFTPVTIKDGFDNCGNPQKTRAGNKNEYFSEKEMITFWEI
jgi:hypothetical protein